MTEKKFIIHSMTVENEKGEILKLNFDNYTAEAIKPDKLEDIPQEDITSFWIRSGGFIAAGTVALHEKMP